MFTHCILLALLRTTLAAHFRERLEVLASKHSAPHQRPPEATTRRAGLSWPPPLLSFSAHFPAHPAPSGLEGHVLPEKR